MTAETATATSATATADFTPLSDARLAELREGFDSREANRIAMNAVTDAGIDKVARNFDRARLMQRRFSVTVDNGKVTSQARSGRCWLFSSLNVARFVAKKNLGIKDFEFSQSYAMYFDKLERVNYFMQDVAALVAAGEPSDSRLMQHLLHDVMGDGGQWTMALNVYVKHGAVPKDLFPETASSQNTGQMNTNLRALLRGAVCKLYAGEDAQSVIDETLAAAHRILTIHLGTPPTSFDWEWTDDDGEFHRVGEITPVEFWHKYVDAGLEDYVCLVDDPRAEHPKGVKIGIEHLGNVVGGTPTEYLNVPVSFMKECARRIMSEQGIPVWFGADCHPMMDRENGAWATDLFEYGRVYDVDYAMDKEERVRFADSAMNHAMAFVGVDVADDGTTTRRWRVENSWGDKIADKGYFTMSDDWFSEYVYEVAVPKSMLPKEYQEALTTPALMLPAWDPMGALA
ncbi:aminopeptidase C [Bifidobacterium tissieri]|uniref:Aminopeptidase n=1 Tax=Bifidobacterium tissieri TaxID=1630162 RepID=A0A261FIN2_9BIFI|nr:C1 family peptidase [Bifidobacterium tissieri]OZG58716.1 aminopeptidase C [Bifidobacterium tissieri]